MSECSQGYATSMKPHGIVHIVFTILYASAHDTLGLIWGLLSQTNFQPGMETVITLKFTEKNQSGEDVQFVDKFSQISVSKAKS